MSTVSVAIPTLNGAATLGEVLAAVRRQRLPGGVTLELLVCDSGSTDPTVAIAHGAGAEVIHIAPREFSHGATRNLLMERSRGDHVALLTQDAVPAGERWLASLLGAFTLADGVGLAFGPYLPRAGASPMVARELIHWFGSFSPDGTPRVDRLSAGERDLPAGALLGRRGYFTDANGCLSRAAWEQVPFRRVPYAEDHVLAHDMLRAGYAKVYLPDAGVVHSHEYSSWGWLRRSFDEARALHGIYGSAGPADIRRHALQVWGLTGADWRWARATAPGTPPPALLARSAVHHAARAAGTMLGARAERLPGPLVRRLSLEGTL